MIFGMSVIGLGLALCVKSPMVIGGGVVAVLATFAAALVNKPNAAL